MIEYWTPTWPKQFECLYFPKNQRMIYDVYLYDHNRIYQSSRLYLVSTKVRSNSFRTSHRYCWGRSNLPKLGTGVVQACPLPRQCVATTHASVPRQSVRHSLPVARHSYERETPSHRTRARTGSRLCSPRRHEAMFGRETRRERRSS